MIPKLPVLSAASLQWRQRRGGLPSVLDAGPVHYYRMGRTAIEAACRTMGLEPEDEVLLPAYHCVSMVEPVLRAGARPVFYRLQPDTRIDPEELRRCAGPRTRAAIVPHYFGFHQPIAAIRAICNELGISLIEDCAHSFFGSIDGHPIGSFGHYAVASPWKFLPVMEGGCLIINGDVTLFPPAQPPGRKAELKSLLNNLERSLEHQRLRASGVIVRPLIRLSDGTTRRGTRPPGEKEPPDPRVADSTPRAELPGLTRVSRTIIEHSDFDRSVRLRRDHYLRLLEIFSSMRRASPLHDNLPDHVVPQVFPLVMTEPERTFQPLKDAGVPIIRFGEYLWEGLDPDTCPVTPELSRTVFQIPCHQELTLEEVDWIGRTVRQLAG